jgi:glycosyltransferase involved in cell wall biosynthesis
MTTPALADNSIATPGRPLGDSQDLACGRPDALFVLSNMGIGGSERKIVRLANRLADEGVNVALASLNGPYTLANSLRSDVPCTRLERKGKFSFAALWRLRGQLRSAGPAVVLAVNLYASLYVVLATLLLRQRPRIVALVNTSTYLGSRLRKWLFQAVLACFDLTVHGSHVQRRFWVKPGSGSWRKSTVVYNGVDSARFEINGAFEAGKCLRASLGVKPESLLIGTVGMCRPEKNQQVLLTTLRRLRVACVDAHLVIAGAGPLLDMLKRRAAELGVADHAHFVGALDDVRPVLAALDVFVLPSIAVESFSNAALEAMSMARPVVLSDIGGAREMISDGVEGYVVSPSELAARLPAIIAAMHSDRRRRQRMGLAARNRAVAGFSVAAMVDGYRGMLHGGSP